MPQEKLIIEDYHGKKLTYEQTKQTAVTRAKLRLQQALPGREKEYYATALEKILVTAATAGYTIESATAAYILKVKASEA